MKLKFIMKYFYLIIFSFSISVYSQNPDEIQLQTNGYGANENEAIMDALRMAVENAYGVFINTSTTIINDQLIENEIKSLGKGNIIDYTIISQSKINNTYSVNLKSTVSLSKMMEFGKNSGQEINFNGGLFARNLKLQELYEKNEYSIIKNFIRELNQIYKTVFDYSINYTNPVLGSSGRYKVDIQVNTHVNDNSKNIEKILRDLKFISMDLEDAIAYKKINKPVFPIIISINEDENLYLILRSKLSRDYFLANYSDITRFYMKNFVFSDGLKTDFKKFKYNESYGINRYIQEIKQLNVSSSLPILESLNYEYLNYYLHGRAINNQVRNGRVKNMNSLIGFHSNFCTHKYRNDNAHPFVVNSKIAGSWYKRKGNSWSNLMSNYESEYNTIVGNFTAKLLDISKSYSKTEAKKMKQFLKVYRYPRNGLRFPWILNSLDFLIKKSLNFQDNQQFGKIFSYFNFQILYSEEELSQLKIFSVKPNVSLYQPKIVNYN